MKQEAENFRPKIKKEKSWWKSESSDALLTRLKNSQRFSDKMKPEDKAPLTKNESLKEKKKAKKSRKLKSHG